MTGLGIAGRSAYLGGSSSTPPESAISVCTTTRCGDVTWFPEVEGLFSAKEGDKREIWDWLAISPDSIEINEE